VAVKNAPQGSTPSATASGPTTVSLSPLPKRVEVPAGTYRITPSPLSVPYRDPDSGRSVTCKYEGTASPSEVYVSPGSIATSTVEYAPVESSIRSFSVSPSTLGWGGGAATLNWNVVGSYEAILSVYPKDPWGSPTVDSPLLENSRFPISDGAGSRQVSIRQNPDPWKRTYEFAFKVKGCVDGGGSFARASLVQDGGKAQLTLNVSGLPRPSASTRVTLQGTWDQETNDPRREKPCPFSDGTSPITQRDFGIRNGRQDYEVPAGCNYQATPRPYEEPGWPHVKRWISDPFPFKVRSGEQKSISIPYRRFHGEIQVTGRGAGDRNLGGSIAVYVGGYYVGSFSAYNGTLDRTMILHPGTYSVSVSPTTLSYSVPASCTKKDGTVVDYTITYYYRVVASPSPLVVTEGMNGGVSVGVYYWYRTPSRSPCS